MGGKYIFDFGDPSELDPVGETEYTHALTRSIESPTDDISELHAIQREICRRIVLGEKGTHIAREMGITPTYVYQVKNSALGQRYQTILHGAADSNVIDINDRLRHLVPTAVSVLEEIMLDEDEVGNVKSNNARYVIDRVLGKPVQTQVSLKKRMSEDTLKEILDRSQRFKGAIDATFAESEQAKVSEKASLSIESEKSDLSSEKPI